MLTAAFTFMCDFQISQNSSLTFKKNVNGLPWWITNTIVSSTSVAPFILFTSDGEREGHRTVVTNSCPDDAWCWHTFC